MMHAILDLHALKAFTKALLCLSKYGDELTLHASTDVLALSATNSSKSAYCRIKLAKSFFSRYRTEIVASVDSGELDVPEDMVGQVLTKVSTPAEVTSDTTLGMAVIVVSIETQDDRQHTTETNDVESKLIVRMHCKHGVVKTHRLLLMTHNTLLAPSVSDHARESRVIIGSRMLKEMLEHFPAAKGKSDPRLIWSFGEMDVGVKSLDTSIENNGKAQISTELTINVNEFDDYSVHEPPITIAFHLREFNATISYADSMNLSLVLRFTDPTAPLYIDIDGENDSAETLFVISTSQVHGAPSRAPNPINNLSGAAKRDREERTVTPAPSKRPIRAVQPIEISANMSDNQIRTQTRAVASPALSSSRVNYSFQTNAYGSEELDTHQPLFWPSPPRANSGCRDNILICNAVDVDEMELEATQSKQGGLSFHPLFED
ncbi:hypothetical protein APHAL10511_000179 [Amanita phalloides]|nr:hypothetical protein APHAL10511_000179 [Amanita phalloides]